VSGLAGPTFDLMDGQVLGGGVVVLVAVVLWLVYLLPSWHGRHQFDAAERNALRLNRALRVLAETSEAPREVEFELNARTAHAQQRLARQVQAERERAELEAARAELAIARAQAKAETAAARERARVEAAAAAELARVEAEAAAERARAEAEAAAERARAEAAAAAERARADAALAQAEAVRAAEAARIEAAEAAAFVAAAGGASGAVTSESAVRRARARRRARLVTTLLALCAAGAMVWGIVMPAASVLLWTGLGVVAVCAVALHRMAAVARRAAARVPVAAVPAARAAGVAGAVQDVALASDRAEWTPRELPRPLTASAGSRAAAVLDEAAARDALRQARVDEAIRARAARQAPPSLGDARRERATAGAGSELTGTDDASIEAHVRQLLERRAVGA
jgi:hypothetical protein